MQQFVSVANALALVLVCFVTTAVAPASIVVKTSSNLALNCDNVCLDARNGGISYNKCSKAFNVFGGSITCTTLPTAVTMFPLTCQCRNPAPKITYLTAEDGSLLSTPSIYSGVSGETCPSIHRACTSCSKRRQPYHTKTTLVCTACAAGWRLRKDGLFCDCSPGFFLNGTLTASNSWCTTCKKPQYCTGGDADTNPDSLASSCDTGLGTRHDGARSIQQCVTVAGFGRKTRLSPDGASTIMEVFECPVGTWNGGGNTADCTNCPAGLTTVEPGATNVTQCVAPPGSYVDRGIGMLCPRGTYQPDYNTNAFCLYCPSGLTTPQEGSTSLSNCTIAKPGYYLTGPNAAEPCPSGTYNEGEGAITACTSCPHGYRTIHQGAVGESYCFAPPGYELVPGNENITQCPRDWYKEGWNRNRCVPCGDGLRTAGTGAVSYDDCGVPPGYGVVSLNPLVAEMCTNNRYGTNVTRVAAADARCETCPAGLYTMDVLTGIPATEGYKSSLDCLLMPGYGMVEGGLVEPCPTGTYNTGFNREACTDCPSGYSTDPDTEGSASMNDCRVMPGWVVSPMYGHPQPCDKGTYSPGGNATNPHISECIQCPAGFTTQLDESKGPEDCSVCEAGYGGAGCTRCPHDTYNAGGSDNTCPPCPTNHVSSRGSTTDDACVPDMSVVDYDYLALSDESMWVPISGAATPDACKQSCRANGACAMFRYAVSSSASGDKCFQLLESQTGTNTWGFRVPSVRDYELYQFAPELRAGRQIQDVGTVTAKQCMDACTLSTKCELFVITTASVIDAAAVTSCQLYQSELDADWYSVYHIQGNRLYSDVILANAEDPSGQWPLSV